MTITTDHLDIANIIKAVPSSGGSHRTVWFVDDIVIKQENDDNPFNANVREYKNYTFFGKREHNLSFENEVWEVKFVETVRLSDTLIVQRRAYGTRLHESWECEVYESSVEHHSHCQDAGLQSALRDYLQELKLYDIHCDNYLVDKEKKIFYVFDFAD